MDLFLAHAEQTADSRVLTMADLSTLELIMAVACTHVAARPAAPPPTFEVAFSVYQEFSLDPKNKSFENFSKDVAFVAFQRLLLLEIVVHAETTSRAPSAFRNVRVLVTAGQVLSYM